MPQKSFRQALNEALHHEMGRDPTVIVLGEDIAGGAGASGQQDAWGGAFGVTKGLLGARLWECSSERNSQGFWPRRTYGLAGGTE